MARFYIYKGDRASDGAQNLKNALIARGHRCMVLRAQGSLFQGGPDKRLINWGTRGGDINRLVLLQGRNPVANGPGNVANANNKLTTLTILERAGVPIVPYFTNCTRAIEYVQHTRGRIYVRTQLTGHSGEGIHIILREDDPQGRNREARAGVEFPIYTIGEGNIPRDVQNSQLFTVGNVGRRTEWRVHVAFGQAILAQKKVRRTRDDDANANSLVRNLGTGWVYSVNYDAPEGDLLARIKEVGVNAVSALGLEFGAVDIIVDEATHTPRVLEVNTAPGLEGGTTLEAYCDAFIRWANT